MTPLTVAQAALVTAATISATVGGWLLSPSVGLFVLAGMLMLVAVLAGLSEPPQVDADAREAEPTPRVQPITRRAGGGR